MNFLRRVFSTVNTAVKKPPKGLEQFYENGMLLPQYKEENRPTFGRAWNASELRLKSFDDLHKLWWTVIKECNVLYTQKDEARRRNVRFINSDRLTKCRQSLARIKTVLTERQKSQKLGEQLLLGEKEFLEEKQKQHTISKKERARGFRKWTNWNNGRMPLFT